MHNNRTIFVQIPSMVPFLPIQMSVFGSSKTANEGQAAGLPAMMLRH